MSASQARSSSRKYHGSNAVTFHPIICHCTPFSGYVKSNITAIASAYGPCFGATLRPQVLCVHTSMLSTFLFIFLLGWRIVMHAWYFQTLINVPSLLSANGTTVSYAR